MNGESIGQREHRGSSFDEGVGDGATTATS